MIKKERAVVVAIAVVVVLVAVFIFWMLAQPNGIQPVVDVPKNAIII